VSTVTKWEGQGRQTPSFGVLSLNDFSRERNTSHRGDRLDTGERSIIQSLEQFEHIFGPLPRKRALDFGCGAGHLTLALAREFDCVMGLDAVPSMLVEAERNADEIAVSNVVFAYSDDLLLEVDEQFDFVSSQTVQQHIPMRRRMRTIQRLIEKVRPGGGFLLRVSLRSHGPMQRVLHWMQHNLVGYRSAQSHCMRLSMLEPAMRMSIYPLQLILAGAAKQGVEDFHVSVEVHATALNLVIMGRKNQCAVPRDGVEGSGGAVLPLRFE
jgi:2-polyprenyl-3-methyl-5-hydroxy-6-metoxy-1,4-benzoquinol methylase